MNHIYMLQLVQREQHSRQEFEKGAREDADKKWQTLKKVLEDEINILKEKLEVGLVDVQWFDICNIDLANSLSV